MNDMPPIVPPPNFTGTDAIDRTPIRRKYFFSADASSGRWARLEARAASPQSKRSRNQGSVSAFDGSVGKGTPARVHENMAVICVLS